MFAQQRVQEFVPAHGKPTLNKIVKSFDEFIDVAFNDDGSYNSRGLSCDEQVKIIRIVSGVLLRHRSCVPKLNE